MLTSRASTASSQTTKQSNQTLFRHANISCAHRPSLPQRSIQARSQRGYQAFTASPVAWTGSHRQAMKRVRAHAGGHGDTATKHVLVPIANGTEEMEAVIIIDVLRRAGAEVVVASVEDDLQVTCARSTKLVADESITSAAKKSYDLIALPGGMPGAERLRDCPTLDKLLHAQRDAHKPYAAICASPAVVLEAKGLIGPDQKATVHPAFESKLKNQVAIQQRVVEDGLLTTSRGPGTAFEFALTLVRQLYGEDKMKAVAGPMVMPP